MSTVVDAQGKVSEKVTKIEPQVRRTGKLYLWPCGREESLTTSGEREHPHRASFFLVFHYIGLVLT